METNKIRTLRGDVSNLVQQYIHNIMSITISKASSGILKKYINKEKNILQKTLKLNMVISTNSSTCNILSNLSTIFIYGYGGLKVINNKMSIGELIAYQQYIRMLIGPCINAIGTNTKIQQASVSIKRMFDVLDEPITQNFKNIPNEISSINKISFNKIVFDNVTFYYDKNIKILNGINIAFIKGTITAIVGASGCGKSTIWKLLFRLWEIDSGKIYIDNINIKNYNLNILRKNICIITQEILLLDDSIFNNLILGNKNIDIKQLNIICDKVGLLDIINALPHGLNTIIGEKGVKLSEGQKQRISIARALITNASIIVFDEATSALDNISQKSILQNISEFLEDKVTIVIAHRLSTIKNASKICVMNNGEIVEEGLHDELLSNKKFYYELINQMDVINIDS